MTKEEVLKKITLFINEGYELSKSSYLGLGYIPTVKPDIFRDWHNRTLGFLDDYVASEKRVNMFRDAKKTDADCSDVDECVKVLKALLDGIESGDVRLKDLGTPNKANVTFVSDNTIVSNNKIFSENTVASENTVVRSKWLWKMIIGIISVLGCSITFVFVCDK